MPEDERMAADQEQTAIRTLIQENQRLKQRVFDLEEKLRKMAPSTEPQAGQGSSVLKLIEHKDFQLQQYAGRLEEKKEQLEEAVRQLEQRNAQLALWMASLRLYQEIFENDATAMIGVNKDARIILFNRTAPQLLGEKFKESLHQPIESVDFRAFDPDTPKRVRESLAGRKPVDSSVVVRDRRILTSVYPIGTEVESRGALLRIQVTSSK
jgi:PAS domain-containing protein